jgi:predicted DCC family thiol-disulfide oxidoreductase YuxK
VTTGILSVVYDGDCGFCVRTMRLVRTVDVFSSVTCVRSEEPDVLVRFPVLRATDLLDAMWVVDETGRVDRGFFAFRRIVRRLPLAWPLLIVFYFPGASVIGPRIYAWVARNRRRFGCDSSCNLPTSDTASRSSRVR